MSIFLGKIIGLYLTIISLAMLLNAKSLKKMIHDFASNRALIIFSGGITLILGLLIVLNYNLWIKDWGILITLAGWFILLKGLFILFFPEAIVTYSKKIETDKHLTKHCWIPLIWGLLLIYFSFFY
ncbi:MAG: hypothetical protein JW769_02625 [Parachlamydiales bacterium]|nr:hypothetical protein [Parachlamydiales bacterium]